MKNIIFVAYQFPPFGGSHATRTVAMANAMALNNKVYVVAPKLEDKSPMYDKELIKKLNKNISIISVDLGILHKKYYEKYTNKSNETSRNLKSSLGIKQKLKHNLNKYKERILIPDPVIDWYPEVMKNIDEIIANINPDVVVSSASPYTCHLIGYKISKKYNIPLILDYGDPWVYEQSRKRGKVRFYIEKRLESKILNHAKKIYVTTSTTKDLYLNKFSISNKKIDVISMGFYMDDFEDNSSENVSEYTNNRKIRIIYGGSLNPIHRDPRPFFKAINKLNNEIKKDLYIEIYCNDRTYEQDIIELNLQNIIKFNDIICHDEFMKKLKKYDLLLLFGNSSSLQVPGKVFNYIGSLTKIYLINNIQEYSNDPTYQIIWKSGDNYSTYNDELKILAEIEKIHSDWNSDKLNKNVKNKSEQYTWENIMKKIVSDINEI